MTGPELLGAQMLVYVYEKVENRESRVHRRVGEMDHHSRRYKDRMELLRAGLRLARQLDPHLSEQIQVHRQCTDNRQSAPC